MRHEQGLLVRGERLKRSPVTHSELEIRETHWFCANDNNKITEKEWRAVARHSKNPII